jgi:hypothetical protein
MKWHSKRPCVHCGLPSGQHRDWEGKQRCISGGPPRFYKPAFGSALDRVAQATPHPMPDLGDPALTWPAVLNEPEINSIHASVAFLREACKAPVPIIQAWWEHYGPTLEALSNHLYIETEGPDAKPPIEKQSTVSSTDNSIFPDSE